ncbi:uncharacterized protein CTHT_0053800 [Thermochaetoides thermophila DSM 1495]|uniref:Uncharacterized protein n=1 Tax=Chaetomium thermophilum (strain DSM 1495 / CBS 144.50 / IMI 039719) TaxID=759272 RepID=G0SBJ5_CHATD|nr:hypothetical protein CTHT_0053800 [Thermochaetoides thermophila DSM 1495]EGS18771.1 hypothetical protein CTHT_0053800 [Thermochaetoides thermophila DSM 1495]
MSKQNQHHQQATAPGQDNSSPNPAVATASFETKRPSGVMAASNGNSPDLAENGNPSSRGPSSTTSAADNLAQAGLQIVLPTATLRLEASFLLALAFPAGVLQLFSLVRKEPFARYHPLR